MELKERLSIQSKNLTALVYRALGIHPEKGAIIHQALIDTWPEEWPPMEVEESFTFSGGIEVLAKDVDGQLVTIGPGNWTDRDMADRLWETVVPFLVESSRGIELFVVENSNTMVYVPKCRVMISTGLPDASVMKAITGNSGSQAFTKCPVDANGPGECRYPYCLATMVVTPQPSIKAAKTAYRDSVCVALTRNSQGTKMLFLTNGANHLNLVNLEQAVETAWNTQWLLNLRSSIERFGFEEPDNLESKLQSLMEAEELRKKDAAKVFEEAKLETVIVEETDELPENIAIKEKKPKKKGRKRKVEADLSELDPETEVVIEAETDEQE
jgi:hypothetical protein